MSRLDARSILDLGDQQLEYRFLGPQPHEAPTLVLLHEGLGCVGLWGEFPDHLAAATGCGVFVYSRAGYGASSPVPLPRPLSYMHDEALEVLPRLLDAIGFRRGILVGHSDGASIAAIYAGGVKDERVQAISLQAPHFFTEDMTVVEIAKAKQNYEHGGLKAKLARWHKDVDVAFWGWNGAWLDPDFKAWNISDFLPGIGVPVQIVQGEGDQYGTIRQIEVAQEHCRRPPEVTLIPKIGHSPYREAPQMTVEAVAGFCDRVFAAQGEGEREVVA